MASNVHPIAVLSTDGFESPDLEGTVVFIAAGRWSSCIVKCPRVVSSMFSLELRSSPFIVCS